MASWQTIRDRRLTIDDKECQECGCSNDLQVHHIIPASEGGSDDLENLITLCTDCHSDKHPHQSGLIEATTRTNRTGGKVPYVPRISELERCLEGTSHPQDRFVLLLASKLGLGASEISDIQLDQVYTKNGGFGLVNNSEQRLPYIKAEPDRYQGRGGRHGLSYLPLDAELEHSLLRWLLIRPDTSHDNLLCNVTKTFGEEMSGQQISERVKRSSGRLKGTAELNSVFEHHYPGCVNVKRHLLGRVSLDCISASRVFTDYKESIYKLDWSEEKHTHLKKIRRRSAAASAKGVTAVSASPEHKTLSAFSN